MKKPKQEAMMKKISAFHYKAPKIPLCLHHSIQHLVPDKDPPHLLTTSPDGVLGPWMIPVPTRSVPFQQGSFLGRHPNSPPPIPVALGFPSPSTHLCLNVWHCAWLTGITQERSALLNTKYNYTPDAGASLTKYLYLQHSWHITSSRGRSAYNCAHTKVLMATFAPKFSDGSYIFSAYMLVPCHCSL